LDSVLVALEHLCARTPSRSDTPQYPDFREGRSMLSANTEALLGAQPKHRGVRIMVTMSTEAADDYQLVKDLVARGMNCMRINCAHDDPDRWAKMIEHLKRARTELAMPCRVQMDLAGPKLRTGAIEPGPRVVVWHPKRDSLGQVTESARVWLAAEGLGPAAVVADATLPVASKWLAELKAGERIQLRDARGKRR